MIVASFIIAFISIYFYFKWRYQYWARKNVPFLTPSIPYGNMTSPFDRTENLGVTMKMYFDRMKSYGWKFGGIFFSLTPVLLPIDLDLIKSLMTANFDHFADRGLYENEKDDPLSAHLFAIGMPKWRRLRTQLSPAFTSSKMKMMFATILACRINLLVKMDLEIQKNQPIDIKEILGCFTTDVIGSCAFDLDLKTIQQKNSPFRKYGKKLFQNDTFRLAKFTFASTFPKLAKKLRISTTPKDIAQFFMTVVKDTVEYRRENIVRNKDLLQLLMDSSLTTEEIAAQCFVFFLAGFETSSTTMTFVLYELSKRPDLQDKVRQEIREVLAKYKGITYEALQDLKYLDQVMNETLRKYPPIPFVTRNCIRDYHLPGTDILIDVGCRVFISILGIHYDPEIYPDPERFDPDRFSEENIARRHPYAHIPFGEGPRNCIGKRFGLMQSKVALISLLNLYKFRVSGKTLEPIKMQVKLFVLAVEGEVWLEAEKV